MTPSSELKTYKEHLISPIAISKFQQYNKEITNRGQLTTIYTILLSPIKSFILEAYRLQPLILVYDDSHQDASHKYLLNEQF